MVRFLAVGVGLGTVAGLLAQRRNDLPTFVPRASAAVRAEAPSARRGEPVTLEGGGHGESLERLMRPELYRRAQAAGIPGRSEMTKAELIAALRATRTGHGA